MKKLGGLQLRVNDTKFKNNKDVYKLIKIYMMIQIHRIIISNIYIEHTLRVGK